MKLLAVGFDRSAQERLSAALSAAGHQVLAATGQVSARTLARAATPDALVVPGGPAGEVASSWVSDLLPGLRAFVLPADADPEEVVRMVGSARPSLAPSAPTDAAGAGETRLASPPAPRVADYDAAEAPMAVSQSQAPARSAELARPAGDARIASKLADVRFGDYHAILETSEGASPALIREQHERLSRFFTPAGWPSPLGAGDIAQLDEIARGVEDAFTILDDPDLRARYERALKSAAHRPAAGHWR
ncbi:MAG: hypothetical protein R3F39_01315 [Myxococcota bacterium]